MDASTRNKESVLSVLSLSVLILSQRNVLEVDSFHILGTAALGTARKVKDIPKITVDF